MATATAQADRPSSDPQGNRQPQRTRRCPGGENHQKATTHERAHAVSAPQTWLRSARNWRPGLRYAAVLPEESSWILLCMPRSEEHTSELQSRFDLVCRLLLEKEKSPV